MVKACSASPRRRPCRRRSRWRSRRDPGRPWRARGCRWRSLRRRCARCARAGQRGSRRPARADGLCAPAATLVLRSWLQSPQCLSPASLRGDHRRALPKIWAPRPPNWRGAGRRLTAGPAFEIVFAHRRGHGEWRRQERGGGDHDGRPRKHQRLRSEERPRPYTGVSDRQVGFRRLRVLSDGRLRRPSALHCRKDQEQRCNGAHDCWLVASLLRAAFGGAVRVQSFTTMWTSNRLK